MWMAYRSYDQKLFCSPIVIRILNRSQILVSEGRTVINYTPVKSAFRKQHVGLLLANHVIHHTTRSRHVMLCYITSFKILTKPSFYAVPLYAFEIA
jgi:hypothetical protein